MHPHTGYYQLSQDHLADLRHQAQRGAQPAPPATPAAHGHTHPPTPGQRFPHSPAMPWPWCPATTESRPLDAPTY